MAVKVAVFEKDFERKIQESAIGAFKNIWTAAVYFWYIKDTFAVNQKYIQNLHLDNSSLSEICLI